MKNVRLLLIFSVVFIGLFFTAGARAEEADIEDEIARQIGGLDLSTWEEYFKDASDLVGLDIDSVDEFILMCSEAEGGDLSLFETVLGILKNCFQRSRGAVAALTAAALVTALTVIAPDEGVKKTLSVILCSAAAAVAAGALTALFSQAVDSVKGISGLTEKTLPVMSSLLVSLGSTASAGVYRPLMVFLSGTVVKLFETAVLPLVLAGGIVSLADAMNDEPKLDEFIKLSQKAVKWIVGLITTFYVGVASIQGMTAASHDGIAVRTAKYAIDKLVPVVGTMVSGTVDSVMGCSLLLRNGIGAAALLMILTVILRPLIVLISGIFVFRVAAAVVQPVAEPRIVRLISNAADTASGLFACVAACGAMLMLTILVFTASGGLAAGLW